MAKVSWFPPLYMHGRKLFESPGNSRGNSGNFLCQIQLKSACDGASTKATSPCKILSMGASTLYWRKGCRVGYSTAWRKTAMKAFHSGQASNQPTKAPRQQARQVLPSLMSRRREMASLQKALIHRLGSASSFYSRLTTTAQNAAQTLCAEAGDGRAAAVAQRGEQHTIRDPHQQ